MRSGERTERAVPGIAPDIGAYICNVAGRIFPSALAGSGALKSAVSFMGRTSFLQSPRYFASILKSGRISCLLPPVRFSSSAPLSVCALPDFGHAYAQCCQALRYVHRFLDCISSLCRNGWRYSLFCRQIFQYNTDDPIGRFQLWNHPKNVFSGPNLEAPRAHPSPTSLQWSSHVRSRFHLFQAQKPRHGCPSSASLHA